MLTKQACALWSATPGSEGWQFADVSEEVRRSSRLCELVPGYEGSATVAGYTVLYQGDSPWRAVAVFDLPGGARTVAYSESGDVIEIATFDGPLTYRVSDILIVDPDDVHVLAPTPEPAVTLVTCYPFYFVGHAPKRYIVRAVLEQR